jgi:MinD-like ATPase involved in chromosome partitioning or flagellar assembly
MNTSTVSTDQAEGLRTIFGAELSTVICIASTLDVDSTIVLGHGLAHALKKQGNKVLLVDEFSLSERKTMAKLLYPVRYDLGQVFNNSIELKKCIKQIEENLWYAAGSKLKSSIESRNAYYPKLDRRLIDSSLNIDYILLPTNSPLAKSISYYGDNIKRIIVTSPDEKSLKNALNIIRSISIFQADEPLQILMVGSEKEGEATESFERLKEASQKAIGEDLSLLGWIEAVNAQRVVIDPDDFSLNPPTSGPTQELVLPKSFFKLLSANILI